MRNPLRRISDWLKYEWLGHYLALKGFERDAAMGWRMPECGADARGGADRVGDRGTRKCG